MYYSHTIYVCFIYLYFIYILFIYIQSANRRKKLKTVRYKKLCPLMEELNVKVFYFYTVRHLKKCYVYRYTTT